jgi:hypothetical protein
MNMAKTDEQTLALIKLVAQKKEEIKKLIKLVAQKKEEIKKAEKHSFITNCSFSFSPEGGNSINLHLVRDVDTFLHIAAFLIEREKNFAEAAAKLGVENVPKFKWGGYLASDWMLDLKAKLDKIQISEKKQKLEVLEQRLNSIISPELRRELELEAIKAELG